jgi:hydroxymethylpyrimidine pyrophosphatase-like HAD family hydrolase
MKDKMKIAIDFDGTVVEHRFPDVGENVPRAIEILRALVMKGHQLILYTMRSDEYLKDAVNWFKENDIPLYGIQYDPEQIKWTSSNKCNAHLVIDDRNLGIPLTYPGDSKDYRPYVDWNKVEDMLIDMGVL